MYSHLCCTKHGQKASNLLETQKVDGNEGRLMCGPLPQMAFFGGFFLNCAKSDHRFLLTFFFCFGNTVLIEFIQ